MAKITTELLELFGRAIGVGIIGGVIAVILSAMFGAFGTGLTAGIVVTLILIFALIYLKKFAAIDSLTVFNFVIYLAAIGLIGTILTTIFPAIRGYILAVSDNWTTSGLLYTVLYITIAEIILQKIVKIR